MRGGPKTTQGRTRSARNALRHALSPPVYSDPALSEEVEALAREIAGTAFEQEIKPRGIIEQMYVHDISSIVWEILRLRRCKVVIINSAFRRALENLLGQVLRQPGQSDYDVKDEAQALAQAWFTDQEAKKQVSEILS